MDFQSLVDITLEVVVEKEMMVKMALLFSQDLGQHGL